MIAAVAVVGVVLVVVVAKAARTSVRGLKLDSYLRALPLPLNPKPPT